LDLASHFTVIDAPSVDIAARLYQNVAARLLARGYAKVQVAVPRGLGSACLARTTRAALPEVTPAVATLVRTIYSHARTEVRTSS
jgi:hypothetical protein